MARLIYLYFLLIICAGAISCASEDGQKDLELDSEVASKPVLDRTFDTGKILTPLAVDGRANESYALYLPKSYRIGYTWPTILLFDPQGNGKKPLKLYKGLADEFGFILIGSNFSANGKDMDEILAHVQALKHNLSGGIKIDPFRIFTIGFSGGARVAVADAISNNDVAGVIGCGAGFPQLKSDAELSFNYLAMVGKQDFNYSEFVILDKELSSRGSKHLLLEFDGKHAWPDAVQMTEAFKWMTVYSYAQREVIDMELMDSLHSKDVQALVKLENSQELRAIAQFYKKMIAYYKGLAKVEEYENKLKLLVESAAFNRYEANLEKILSGEMASRNKYVQAMASNSNDWWSKEMAEIKKEIADESVLEVKSSKERVLAYLSLAAYLQADMALKKNFLNQVNKYLFILNLVDPKNPDYYYLSARFALRRGKNEEAVNFLKEAMKHGFDDWQKVNNERTFDPIRSYLKTVEAS